MKERFHLLLIALLSLVSIGLNAQNNYYGLADTISKQSLASFLIASPSEKEIYTIYGHAGIRINDPVQGLDITFNYGIFDFTEGFFFRFIKGQTDYIVIPEYTSDYLNEYLSRGSTISEIVLNLQGEELGQLWQNLVRNCEPENRVYRYNFFYDNCSTRLIKVIEQAIKDSKPTDKLRLEIKDTKKLENELLPKTWRELINKQEEHKPWLRLGTDLALGKPCDEEMQVEELSFLPQYLKILSEAYLIIQEKDGETLSRPLVSWSKEIKSEFPHSRSTEDNFDFHSPNIILGLILIFYLLQAGFILFKGENYRFSESLLFFLTGLAGLILSYISFFSEHPHTFPNYNIWVLNPINILIAGILLFTPTKQTWVYSSYLFTLISTSSFLLASTALGQSFNPLIYFIALTIISYSFARLYQIKSQDTHQAKRKH